MCVLALNSLIKCVFKIVLNKYFLKKNMDFPRSINEKNIWFIANVLEIEFLKRKENVFLYFEEIVGVSYLFCEFYHISNIVGK